jgi:4-methylaminobutanoate oxidase (formaldehyde-forming)
VDVVVVGGGIVGASSALALAERGASVLVLEQNTLTSGTTWHAAGLVAQLKHCEAMVVSFPRARAVRRRAAHTTRD